ncbi:protein CHUP1 chloroplastic-like, partial [Trifolium medium]|nr:protein CHUP1 chloroplastic-like [Trifolium medium]
MVKFEYGAYTKRVCVGSLSSTCRFYVASGKHFQLEAKIHVNEKKKRSSGNKIIGVQGVFDFDQWSSSQASSLTDSGEYDDFSSVDNSPAAKTNTKIFSKLKRLIQGKDS